MSLSKERREEIESIIINKIGLSSDGQLVQKQIADECGVSAQSVSRIMTKMVNSGRLLKQKKGQKNIYILPDDNIFFTYPLEGLEEDKVYRENVADFIRDVPKCAKDNFTHAFLEMLNNAIEHSGGTEVDIFIKRNDSFLTFIIHDNGVGVFTKVADELNLDEKRYAILELAKGKFTSDPDSHSGEGIFFSSKCGDCFVLESDGIAYVAKQTYAALGDGEPSLRPGTFVLFKINVNHQQTMEELFKQYTDAPERYGFSKTAIPIHLLEYGDKSPIFISRSQARRLLARVERFEVVNLDFSGIDSIGQGFADEIFRVFKKRHPDILLIPVNCTDAVNQMIQHVLEYK